MKIKLILILILTVNLASGQLNINNYIRVGQTRLQIGNYVGAIENFNIVIKFQPQLPEPYFLRGVAKHHLEDFRGAIDDYNKAVSIKHYFPEVYVNRGLAWLELDEYENAIADYDMALELAPRESGIYNNRGIAKMSMKNFDGAIEDYNKALEYSPNFVNAYINRSNANIMKGDLKEAIRDLNRAIMIRPHFASAYLLRGLARFQMNDYASALRDFDQTLRLDPQNAHAFNNRGIVKQELEDYEGAIVDYDVALKLDPTLPNAYFNRGIAKEILKRPGSEQDYMIAAKLDPKLDIRKYRQAQEEEYYAQQQTQQQQTQQQEGKEQQERRRFRLALADTRNLPDMSQKEEIKDGRIQNKNVIVEMQSIFVISSFSENSVDYERLQYYNLTLEELNRFNNYKPLMTVSNRETFDFAESFKENIQYFDEKLKNNSRVSKNYLSRGIFKLLTFEYNDALNDFDQSIKLDEKSMLSYFSRANCRTKMAELIESVPDNSGDLTVPLNDQGNTRTAKNKVPTDYQDILDDYLVCSYMAPQFPFAYYNKAYVLCKLDKYDEALKDLEKAIELQPDFAEAFYNRGLIKIYLDDISGAALDLSKAGELGIEDAYNIIKRYCN